MRRAVVCVATTDRYRRGMERLRAALANQGQSTHFTFYDQLPSMWSTHEDKPYAFKAYALKQAADDGADLVLWCDACILPIRSLEPLWDRIEREGYWFCNNGYLNYTWTADSAYPDLFTGRDIDKWSGKLPGVHDSMTQWQALNRTIPHVVATAFGLNLKSDIGKAFLEEYFRLASETRAFCGPWTNKNVDGLQDTWAPGTDPVRVAPCGPPDVRGHRHDQTAASVIAWRLGCKLVDPPEIFAYPPGDERTILLADGSYE